ncbi:MAG TPA: TonB family protein [Blastocatellia bacterium]
MSFWRRLRREARYRRLFVLSVVAHVLFFAAIIRLDLVMKFARAQPQPAPAPSVRIIEVPLEGFPSDRLQPEQVERAEESRFHLDPESTDDIHLTNRSPNPASAATGNARRPSGGSVSARAEGGRGPGASASDQNSPPAVAPIRGGGLLAIESPPIAGNITPGASAQLPPAPVATSAKEDTALPAGGEHRRAGLESASFGFEERKAQFIAHIRSKIRQVNERIAPRELIKTLLADEVSAEFELRLRRDGRIKNLRMTRSSGYGALDSMAREAIYNASPFVGYPPEAGDEFSFTVRVFYHPVW